MTDKPQTPPLDPYDSIRPCGCAYARGEQITVCPEHRVPRQKPQTPTEVLNRYRINNIDDMIERVPPGEERETDLVVYRDVAAALLAGEQREQELRADVVRMAISRIGDKCEHHRLASAELESLTIRECPICWKACAEQAEASLVALRAERDDWRQRFGLQTSGGWQTAAEAEKAHQDAYKAAHTLIRQQRDDARAERDALREALTALVDKLRGSYDEDYRRWMKQYEGSPAMAERFRIADELDAALHATPETPPAAPEEARGERSAIPMKEKEK